MNNCFNFKDLWDKLTGQTYLHNLQHFDSEMQSCFIKKHFLLLRETESAHLSVKLTCIVLFVFLNTYHKLNFVWIDQVSLKSSRYHCNSLPLFVKF